MANIQDLAEHTGLSTATISRYLNQKPYVSKEAQLAIELAMERLDYHPNSSARILRSGKTRRVTVVVDRAEHSFSAALLGGFCDVAWENSYDILIQQSGAPEWTPSLLLEQAAAKSMDGVIIAAEGAERDAFVPLLGSVPVVACDQALFDVDCPHVYIDHYQSTTDGLEYLQKRGARTIACIHGPNRWCASNRFRRNAYGDFARRPGAPTIHEVPTEDDTVQDGYHLLGALRQLDPIPDAVFTGSDDLAAGLIAAARRDGVSVPKQLAILGFDDQPIAEAFEISTIRQPVRKMGRRAMEILMQIIAGGPDTAVKRRTRIKYSLVERNSA